MNIKAGNFLTEPLLIRQILKRVDMSVKTQAILEKCNTFDHLSKICRDLDDTREPVSVAAFGKSKVGNSMKCDKCKRTGHSSKYCWATLNCNNCGLKRHVFKVCKAPVKKQNSGDE